MSQLYSNFLRKYNERCEYRRPDHPRSKSLDLAGSGNDDSWTNVNKESNTQQSANIKSRSIDEEEGDLELPNNVTTVPPAFSWNTVREFSIRSKSYNEVPVINKQYKDPAASHADETETKVNLVNPTFSKIKRKLSKNYEKTSKSKYQNSKEDHSFIHDDESSDDDLMLT